MAYRHLRILTVFKHVGIFRKSSIATTVALPDEDRKFIPKPKEFRTEDKLVYLEDPDNFGTLSRSANTVPDELEDNDDIKEEEHLKNVPLSSQKLTTRQYADLIKQYLRYKRIKEAIDVLEVRMLKEDRVKPSNYIYNILIGACADVGYTKKAFKLFNDMKRRALKPTGDTYTCLFHACANSPWQLDGLKHAHHLKELMIEKSVEPNLTNYNAMIKAFGRCGDLPTAFKIVDEMRAKKIKIRVHTINHLLHACIADKQHGLTHALVVWRKMLNMKEKPNIYTFNLMLRCVKDCNLGSKEDILQLIGSSIVGRPQITGSSDSNMIQSKDIKSEHTMINGSPSELITRDTIIPSQHQSTSNDLSIINNPSNINIQLINRKDPTIPNDRNVPNLLSKVLNLEQVTSLREVFTLQDKFAIIGGQEDFLKEMKVYSVTPDIKIFTQMLPLLDNTSEAEEKLLAAMKSLNVNADISFYNMLIKKRCLRLDYEAAFAVRELIKQESEFRKKRYPHSNKLKLEVNVMTYGVWAMACNSKDSAEQLLNEMKEKQLKVNIEILGTMLRQGTANSNFGYVLFIMNVVKAENIQVNEVFLKHLENFNDKCNEMLGKDATEIFKKPLFKKMYTTFHKYYTNWLKEINVAEVLKPEHPWQQYRENYPETVQRDKVKIQQPKKFYKPNKKRVRYTPKIINET